jgi:hypothetical protein
MRSKTVITDGKRKKKAIKKQERKIDGQKAKKKERKNVNNK